MSEGFAAPAAQQQFGIGKVLATSAAILGRNIVPFGLIALIFSVPTLLLEWFFNPAYTGDLPPMDGPVPGVDLVYSGASFLVATICSGLITGALIYGSFQDLRGQKVGVGECLSRAFATLPLVAVAAIGFSLLVGLGSLLLIVPGIVLAVMYWLYAPAIVVERASIGAAFNRSAELTKGRRWAIFGLLLSFIVISIVFGAVAGAVLSVGGVATILIGLFVVNAVIGAYGAVANAVTYYYLRADKEGVDIEDIAKLFD